jgi:Protein tyrosine and serine/threonine kinase/TMEM151 family
MLSRPPSPSPHPPPPPQRTRTVYTRGPDGKQQAQQRSEQVRVVTHSEKIRFEHQQWTDASDAHAMESLALPVHDRAAVYQIRFTKSREFDDVETANAYERTASEFRFANQYRDQQMDFHESFEIPGFDEHVLVFGDASQVPWWMNSFCYSICVLFCIVAIFRFQFDKFVTDKNFHIEKRVSIFTPGAREQYLIEQHRAMQQRAQLAAANQPLSAEAMAAAASMAAASTPTVEYPKISHLEVKLEKQLASGHFGEVWLAQYRHERVVCKRPKFDDTQTITKQLDDLRQEAAMSERVGRHPCIITFIGACIPFAHEVNSSNDDSSHDHVQPFEHVYMLYEFASFGSVEKMLLDDNQLPTKLPMDPSLQFQNVRILCSMMLDAAMGMAHLHKENVLHRDCACRNLLVTRVADQYRVRVTDFGMSRQLKISAANTQNPGASQSNNYSFPSSSSAYVNPNALQPVRWCSPETLKTGVSSRRSDTWMFGCTMFEAFSRDRPFADFKSNEEVYNGIVSGMISLPVDRLVEQFGAPEEVAQVIRDCCQRKPDRRPSMDQVVERLKAVVASLE